MKSQKKVRLLVIAACSLFLLSILVPFLEATWQGAGIPEIHRGPETFWSFKEHTVHSSFGQGRVEQDLGSADYWSSQRVGRGVLEAWIGPVLVFMFEAQVLTILFAVLTIFRVRPILLFSSTILNAFATFCMWFVSQALNTSYARTLQAGFWLTLPSLVLLIAASFLSWRHFKRTRHSA